MLNFLSAKTTGVYYCGWQPVFYSCFSCVCIYVWEDVQLLVKARNQPGCHSQAVHLVLFLFVDLFIIICMCDCLNVCMCTMYVPAAGRGQKTASNPLEKELRRTLWVLGTKPGSSGRALNILNH